MLPGSVFFVQWLVHTTVHDTRTNTSSQILATCNGGRGVIGP